MEDQVSQSFPDVSNFMTQTYMDAEQQQLEDTATADVGGGEIIQSIQYLDSKVTMISNDFTSVFDTVTRSLDSILGASQDALNQGSTLLEDQKEESRARELAIEEKFLLSEKPNSNVEVMNALKEINEDLQELDLSITKLPRDPKSGFLDAIKGMPKWVIGTLIAMGVVTASQLGIEESGTEEGGNKGTVTPIGEDKNFDGSRLAELISRGESKGDYDIYNYGNEKGRRGLAGSKRGNIQGMTINEIIKQQDAGKMFAVGKYQVIPVTLKEGKQKLGLSGEEKFDAAMQERFFREYLVGSKRRPIQEYITGKSDDIEAALTSLALEFRSVSTTYGQMKSASGSGDKASISREEAAAALRYERDLYQKRKEQTQLAETEQKQPPAADTKENNRSISTPEGKQLSSGQDLIGLSNDAKKSKVEVAKNMVNVISGSKQSSPTSNQNAPELVPAINTRNSMVA